MPDNIISVVSTFHNTKNAEFDDKENSKLQWKSHVHLSVKHRSPLFCFVVTLLTSNNKMIETYQRPSLAKKEKKDINIWKPYILNLVPQTNPLGSKDTKHIDLTKQLNCGNKNKCNKVFPEKIEQNMFLVLALVIESYLRPRPRPKLILTNNQLAKLNCN